MSEKKDVFLLPFAGGSSLIYKQWQHTNFRFHGIDYSGHGFRYQEPLPESIEALTDDVIRQMECVQADHFALFGHSMGGLIAWMVTQKLTRKPDVLFISACEPPECLDVTRYQKYGNDDTLMQYIIDYDRLPEKQRNTKVFQEIIFPFIKNDYRILSEYRYVPAENLDVPMVILYSREDTLMRYEVMEKWKEYGKNVSFFQMKGDHFYLEEEQGREKILEIVSSVVSQGDNR